MTSRSILSSLAVASLASATCLLTSCTWTNNLLEGDKLDYKSQATVKTRSLEVPPDLSSVPRDDRYDVPADRGTTTLSTYNQKKGEQANAPQPGAEVLPPVQDARLERAGGQRWLVVSLKPEQVWPVAKEFWQEQGFLIKTQD